MCSLCHAAADEYCFKNLLVPLWNWQGKTRQTVALLGAAFDREVRRDILHQVVKWQLAKRQQGTHKAKTRREVSGGGRKPWKQKGTGRARAGTIRAPQWRGGGKAHGPVPRSHAIGCSRKVRQMGLRCALSAKAAEGRIIVMDTLKGASMTKSDTEKPASAMKTKDLDRALDVVLAGAPRRSVLIIASSKDGIDGGASVLKASSNLAWVDVLPVAGVNVYSILQRDYLMVSQAALPGLVDRATRPIRRRRLKIGEDPDAHLKELEARYRFQYSPH